MAYASSQANLQPEPPHTWKHEPHEWDLYGNYLNSELSFPFFISLNYNDFKTYMFGIKRT